MQGDAQGHGILGASHGSIATDYDATVESFLQFRIDAGRRLAELLENAPGLGMAHVLDGYMVMVTFNQAQVTKARTALGNARYCLRGASWRERAHVEALSHWIEGDPEETLATWKEILKAHPRDLLAFRLFQNHAFWLGRPRLMSSIAAYVRPRWDAEVPGYATVLACAAFAHEECGDYAAAERAGRAALEREPGNMWATHAIAHVMEMQGRRKVGMDFLYGLQSHWEAANNFKHHLWWHVALYHLARHEIDTVLDLYDRRFRDVSAPLVVATPDLFNDILNATSVLFRLEVLGVSAGSRWKELAEKAERRIGDCLSAFTLPHWMMALAADERWGAAERLLKTIRETAQNARGGVNTTLHYVAAPVCEAVLAHRRGEFASAVVAMRPALGLLQSLGGSHAQRNVLERLFLDSAIKARSEDDVRLGQERLSRHRSVLSAQRIGYSSARVCI
jgi:tetratricopeptide (TPR) repeat protein